LATTIAFCITELDPGGAERAFVRLVKGLDRREWAPHVLTLRDGGLLADELRDAGITVQSLGLNRSSQAWSGLRRVTAALRTIRPQILQTWLYHANILGRIAAWRAGVPHVVAGVRVAEQRSRWRLRIDRWTAGLVDRHVCVSQGVATFMHQAAGIRGDRIAVIPNGVDYEKYAHAAPADLSSFGIPPLSPTVVFAGRLDPQKDPFLFLEAARQVSQVDSRPHFLLVGEGPLRREVERWIHDHDLSTRVHLAGWSDNLGGILKASACFVLSSRWEGMANVLLEAMAAGTPVVTTDVEGVRDLVTNGTTGRIVAMPDPLAVSQAILWVLRDPAAAALCACKAQAIVRERHTWMSFVTSHEHLYKKLSHPT
jgi:glycosyltransferase involved in cell wall biosynthesis